MTNTDEQPVGGEGTTSSAQEPAKKHGDPLLEEVEDDGAAEGPGAGQGEGTGR